ncbi:hypothetical protein [Hymenobacter sp. PAMC 26628]|uniref:hypothetical protein n=1 Tax=Hymenobacter sp. PAMC 26628 TaxID=1484118 RepID=UPI00077013E8|nr:hypothetical protein [Hymenobacter sp. PAMC 26628]AMJ66973.1 hypothetical protein AXW84_17200 [Hymenobacter sp. PAMC 26628]
METLQLVKEIEGLPDEAKQEVEALVLALKLRYSRQTPLTQEELIGWADPEVFGMYADREDMRDSTAYISKLRQEQWGAK